MLEVVQAWKEVQLPSTGPLNRVDSFKGSQRLIGVSHSDIARNFVILQPLCKFFPERVPGLAELQQLSSYIRPRAAESWLLAEAQLCQAQLGWVRELKRRSPTKSRPIAFPLRFEMNVFCVAVCVRTLMRCPEVEQLKAMIKVVPRPRAAKLQQQSLDDMEKALGLVPILDEAPEESEVEPEAPEEEEEAEEELQERDQEVPEEEEEEGEGEATPVPVSNSSSKRRPAPQDSHLTFCNRCGSNNC